ncbi:MAG TPA: GNAT family N-acetyltransferase [Acidimicrobiales bacterium]
MFDATLVLAVLDAVPDAVVDGGWGVDALIGRQTRAHDDLDLVVRSERLDGIVHSLGALGFAVLTDERPTRVVLSRDSGERVDVHVVSPSSSGTTQHLPGGRQFTYMLDDTRGVIGRRSVGCISPDMQVLTHGGYEPDNQDRADIALVAGLSGLAVPPPYAVLLPRLSEGEPVVVRDATVNDVAAACVVRWRAWQAAYRGLMPQAVIDSLDLGIMWANWRGMVERPPSPAVRLFVVGGPSEVHAYTWVRPSENGAGGPAGEVAAIYADPTAWGTGAGWAAFARGVGYLRGQGFSELVLWMLKGNDRAGRFYERAGWQADGTEKTTRTAVGTYVEVRYRFVES